MRKVTTHLMGLAAVVMLALAADPIPMPCCFTTIGQAKMACCTHNAGMACCKPHGGSLKHAAA